MDNLIDQLAEALKPTVTKALTEILRPEAPDPNHDIGNIHRASEVSGYSVSTLYIKKHNGELPKDVAWKRGGRLFFNITKLVEWIKAGNDDQEK